MPRCLMKIAGMESSSKRRRTSSTKKSGADGARVISVRRADMLPRKGVASAGRRKPIGEPSVDAPTEAVVEAIASSKKRVRRPEQTETASSRPKAPRAAGRASGKPKKTAAKELTQLAPAVVSETVEAALPSATMANDESAMTALGASAVGAVAAVETEMVVEASAILEETTIAMPVMPGSQPEKRGLVRTVLGLLSSLRLWTGPRL